MLDIKDIEKLANLARINVPDAEKEGLRKDIDAILGYVGEIQKISPDLGVARAKPDLRNVMREDANPHEKGIFTESLLSSAPEREGQYVKVKKIL